MESLVNAITSPKKKLKLDPLDLLSHAEMGDARELLSEQLQSPSRRSGMRNLYFHKSGNSGEFLLCRDASATEFMMMAKLDEAHKRFDIYRHKPTEPQFNQGSPDAKLGWNDAVDKWVATVSTDSLVCDDCTYKRREGEEGVRATKAVNILNVSQGMEKLPSGQHWFWMDINGKLTECGERRILECKYCDVNIENKWSNNSADPMSPRGNRDIVLSELMVRSAAPSLSPKGNLSVKFISGDRTIQPSARNVQCLNPENEVCFQFVKLGPTKFMVDFKAPLSPLQAFCAALSTHFWV